MFAFFKTEKMEEKSLFYPLASSSFVLLAFFQFLFDFLTTPTNNRLSLNNKGGIHVLRGKGYCLCEIGHELDINRKKMAEKNCAKELNEHHSGVPQITLQIHATPNAGCGGSPRGPQ